MALTLTSVVYSLFRHGLDNNCNKTTPSPKTVEYEGGFEIIHFNDVYNVEPALHAPKAGAARFVTKVRELQSPNTIVLFSGDAFSPSMVSNATRGRHLSPILNSLNVECAVYGNHDFDFGIEDLAECVSDTNFPWLMTNVVDKITGRPLGDGKEYLTIDKFGVRIGLLGLVEEEWIQTLSAVDPDNIVFEDFCESARKWIPYLREECRCDIVIALTHMRWPNDRKLAKEVEGIDLILGGHDHNYLVEDDHGVMVIKSGTDFRQLTKIIVTYDPKTKKDIRMKATRVNVTDDTIEDPITHALVDEYMFELEKTLENVLGQVEVPLEGRFEKIRTQETNLGNFITDIMLTAVEADLALLNSGSLRADKLIPAGDFKIRDLNNILPLLDPVVVLKISGRQIIEALENSVSQYPKLEGRFPAVAGVQFCFDPHAPCHSRIDPEDVEIQGEPIDLDKDDYLIALKQYVATGCDGYDVFKSCPVVLDEENGPTLTTTVQNYFKAVNVVKKFSAAFAQHRPSVISRKKRNQLAKEEAAKAVTSVAQKASKWEVVRKNVLHHAEDTHCIRIAPQVEGRITMKCE